MFNLAEIGKYFDALQKGFTEIYRELQQQTVLLKSISPKGRGLPFVIEEKLAPNQDKTYDLYKAFGQKYPEEVIVVNLTDKPTRFGFITASGENRSLLVLGGSSFEIGAQMHSVKVTAQENHAYFQVIAR